ncbi:MAG: DUF3786 domain-containing protein [Candidatus Bathyarchaeota archaeon]|nr:DUF3786 domain-containing protein [Candidatus Termiticorpusculum sp.]
MAVSNVERLYVYYQKLFLELDHVRIAEKLCLKCDDDYMYVPFFNNMFSINRRSAVINSLQCGNDLLYREKLLILHHMYFHKSDAENSGNMVAFRNLRECADFEPAYQKMTIVPFATYFNKKMELLIQRVHDINGQLNTYGDVSFTVNAFPRIPLQFIFWDGSDEFPANATILFDKNVAQFIHPESIPVLANAGVNILMEKH